MIVYGKTEQETIALTAKSFGIPLAEAEHLLAIGRGEVSGKFVVAEQKASVGKQRQPLTAASRKTLTSLKQRRQKGKPRDTRVEVKPAKKTPEPEMV